MGRKQVAVNTLDGKRYRREIIRTYPKNKRTEKRKE